MVSMFEKRRKKAKAAYNKRGALKLGQAGSHRVPGLDSRKFVETVPEVLVQDLNLAFFGSKLASASGPL